MKTVVLSPEQVEQANRLIDELIEKHPEVRSRAERARSLWQKVERSTKNVFGVPSQSDRYVVHAVTPGRFGGRICSCRDCQDGKAPQVRSWYTCKHVIAVAVYMRVTGLVKERQSEEGVPSAPAARGTDWAAVSRALDAPNPAVAYHDEVTRREREQAIYQPHRRSAGGRRWKQ